MKFTPLVRLALRLAKRLAMGRRTVPLNDLDKGIALALMYLDDPAHCRCFGCVMNAECEYGRTVGFETERQETLALFDLPEKGA